MGGGYFNKELFADFLQNERKRERERDTKI
jgi:hypothetical protein